MSSMLATLIDFFSFQDDRSAINLHLMHTSYFLFVMVITLMCYALVRGRPTVHVKVKQPHYVEVHRRYIIQGPVVQSVVSLTSSLRVISLTVLADSVYNILIFFAEKM